MEREALDAAYRETTYRVFVANEAPIDLRIGERSQRLDEFLARERASEWAFVTAWNPGSQPLSASENRARQEALIDVLDERGFRWLPASGTPADDAWRAEESVLVLGIPHDAAVELGRSFGQLAIVVGRRGGPAELVYCDP